MEAYTFANGQETAHQGGTGWYRSCAAGRARRPGGRGLRRKSAGVGSRATETDSSMHALRRPSVRDDEHILFRGETVAVRVVRSQTWLAPNKIAYRAQHDHGHMQSG